MNALFDKAGRWQLLFFALLASYCLYYAPYGINETDGGFLTGLAWQVLSGKTLYADVVYVRPPLPVWLRALELKIMPEHWAILGERWVFYGKVALYSWLGAAVFAQGVKRWLLAVFGFVLSAHCYPPAAWHTVDGIMCGALSIWCWFRFSGFTGAVFSALFIVGAALCKQSFYPMALLWLFLAGWRLIRERKVEPLLAMVAALALTAFFYWYLNDAGLLKNYLSFTSNATSASQAVQHGLVDFFRIHPLLLVATLALLGPLLFWRWRARFAKLAFWAWVLWLLALSGSYAWTIWERQDFTVPFGQTRLLFWAATAFGLLQLWRRHWSIEQAMPFGALLALSWCAAVSWGYNLPILFAVPWAYSLVEISGELFASAYPGRRCGKWAALCLIALMGLFRWGYEFVYRDGPRSAMTEHLGAVCPRLTGIYSSPKTAAFYRDLKKLSERYGPDFKTLPAVPQANYLAGTKPPLPLDWVVEREIGAGRALLDTSLRQRSPVFFFEKRYLAEAANDPEFKWISALWESGRVVEETDYFSVFFIRSK